MTEKIYLDKWAAHGGQTIVQENRDAGRASEDVDNLVTKALGVLQENGIYACGLYLCSRSRDKEKEIAAVVNQTMVDLLARLPFGWGRPPSLDPQTLLPYLSHTVAGDDKLERVLLAKETLEQMLVYARYGAKAWKASLSGSDAGAEGGA